MTFRNVYFSILAIVALMCSASDQIAAEDPCKGKFENIKLSDQDKEVFTYLNSLSEDRDEFLKSVVFLFALGEANGAPKTIDELVVTLLANKLSPVPEDQFEKSVRGVIQLSAKPTHDALVLILAGKAKLVNKKFDGYKPKGDVRRLLICMEQRYRVIATTGK